jgi:hypothetical protein
VDSLPTIKIAKRETEREERQREREREREGGSYTVVKFTDVAETGASYR